MSKTTNIFLPPSRPSTPSHTTTTVHEHRAPTDESIRLADEMRREAMAAVTGEIHVESTEVHLTLWHDCMGRSVEARMKVGGHKIEARMRLDSLKSPQERMVDLAEDLGKQIAVGALIPLLEQSLPALLTGHERK